MKIYYRYLTLFSYFSLLLIMLLWSAVSAPQSHLSVSIILLFFTVMPLLFVLNSLSCDRPHAYVYSGFLAIYYLVIGIMEAVASENALLWAVLIIILALLLYSSTYLYIRCFPRRNRQA